MEDVSKSQGHFLDYAWQDYTKTIQSWEETGVEKRAARWTKDIAMRCVRGRPFHKGVLYAALPCISARGCFQSLNSGPPGHMAVTLPVPPRLETGTGKETEESNLLQQLSDASLVVDALEPSVREELVKIFCNRELTSYQQIFEGAELAKLDKTERRYAWIKRRLRTNEEIWKIFPRSWHVDYLLCIQFCKLTRSQLVEILVSMKEKPDVATLLTVSFFQLLA
ncbi:hypothetical protein FXO37_12434 [Capsicum annuum]|nr:hypothetical protein FXO37_12434 [Capsicum annuum]